MLARCLRKILKQKFLYLENTREECERTWDEGKKKTKQKKFSVLTSKSCPLISNWFTRRIGFWL